MSNRKPPIYLLTGLILGLVIGVVYAWMLAPEETLETHPAMLREDFKNEYRELIARAYLYDGDLGRAQARLALLEDEDPARELAVQAQLSLNDPAEKRAARALGLLAAALSDELEMAAAEETPAGIAPAAGTPANPANPSAPTATIDAAATLRAASTLAAGGPTATPKPPQEDPEPSGEDPGDEEPTPTITPTATATLTATPGAPFVLNDMKLECNPAIDPPKIQIYVFDAAGQPVPGVAALIFYEGQVDRFVTGLKPTYGLGYADFEMDPAKTYTLRLENGGDPIQSITGRLCEEGGDSFFGSWVFNFVQP